MGHDWGGIVAWWVALRYPDRVQRLAVLNAPHPVAFRRYLLRHPAQLWRSWYAFYFQLPRLPESNFRRANWHSLVRTLRTTSRPGTFTEDDLEQYRRRGRSRGRSRPCSTGIALRCVTGHQRRATRGCGSRPS